MRKTTGWLCALALALLAPVQLAAQAGGTVTGRVSDAASKQPLANVQVIVAGTALQGRTGPDGLYTIRGVPAGRAEVRVARLGYSGGSRAVAVAAGQTATANFELASSTIGLDVLVVQASGEAARRRELGNSVATVSTANVEMAAVQSFSQLVQGRAPGVVVLPSSGQLGAGARIRIRGNNSVSLANDPLLIIDGVRVDNESNSSGLFTGGQSTSRFEDINPEDIENVEVLKGPAAAALYGTAAANGVIQVTTKRGRAGHPTVRAHTEFGTQKQTATIPANFRAIGHTTSGAKNRNCDFAARAAGTCVAVDSLYSFNPLRSSLTPFQTGNVTNLGASVSGGSENATYFVSGENEHGVGVQHPNHISRTNVRANLTGQVGSKLRLTANTGFVQSNIELPQADNSASGPVLNGLLGDPSPGNIARGGGYRPPTTAFSLIAWENREQLNRFTGSANADFRPLGWLSVNGTVGVDVSNRFEGSFVAPGTVGAFVDGFREQLRDNTNTFTSNLGATATKGLTGSLISTTSGGVQYTTSDYNFTYGEAEVIAPGTRNALVPGSVAEGVAPNKLFGAYATEQLALNDRLFVTAGLRGDQNSAFGQNIGFVTYPSLTASWVVNEEPFFPKIDAISNLRLRAAYGKSGLRPGRLSAVRTYATVNSALGTNVVPGFVVSNAGNPDLRPEVTREFEFGADLGFLNDRLTLEATHYDKRSHDALISRPLPPSVGGPGAQFFNLGSVQNIGTELALRAEAIKRDRVGVDFNVNYSTNSNKLLTFGDTSITPIIFGLGANTQRHQVGFALGGYWQPAYTFGDANHDGLIQQSEVQLLPNDQQTDPVTGSTYFGSPFPKREASFSADVRLARFIRLSGLLDYKGGQKLLNFTAINRETSNTLGFSEVRQVPGAATLEQQAAIQARRFFGTAAGYYEDATFWKLREVSVSLTSPQSLNRSLHLPAQGLSFTLAGRNLHTWTKYTGFDPEVNYGGQSNFNTADDFTLPPTRAITARIDVNF
ncbi:MAG TPA: SusC/RagA family TonB-linked outer membrane protein [Longimicrobiaceae bacterium]|jgi:TonB-linked SusC/RagA family outer membrane protein|nr:SusC/RagA family TonB-linked outer membrane protein [Longimicrobiaceae bacterium]